MTLVHGHHQGISRQLSGHEHNKNKNKIYARMCMLSFWEATNSSLAALRHPVDVGQSRLIL